MIQEVRINSEQFYNVKISTAQILAWLQIVRDVSGEADLSIGLKICHMRVLNEDQERARNMVRELIVQEASGNIIPPTKLHETYFNITTTSELEIVERRKTNDRRASV